MGGAITRMAPVGLLSRALPEPFLSVCYHMVSDAPVAHVKHYQFLTTTEFERDLRDLEGRFPYVCYEDMNNPSERGQGKRGRSTSMCLTFDDGFAECASVVRPILRNHRASAIFFVITDLIDNQVAFLETKASLCVDALSRLPADKVETIKRDLGLEARISKADNAYREAVPAQMARQWSAFAPRLRPFLVWLLTISPGETPLLDRLCERLNIDAIAYVKDIKPYLSVEQILQLRSDGFVIGAHSCSHRRLKDLTRRDAEREIVDSCRRIHELTGQASVPFAFPYSGGGLDRTWLARLREAHPFIGLFFDTRGFQRDEPFVIQRVFGERIEETGSIDHLLRRAWTRRLLS